MLPGLDRKDEIGDVSNAVEKFKVLAEREGAPRERRGDASREVESERRRDRAAGKRAPAEAARPGHEAKISTRSRAVRSTCWPMAYRSSGG